MVKRIAEPDKMARTSGRVRVIGASLDCLLRAEWQV